VDRDREEGAATISASVFEREITFMMQAGSPFPNFSLPNQDGKITKLSDFAGHWLVVYFYPKDDTPGCTIQGKAMSADKAKFDAAGIKVVGVSADDPASHKNFCTKFAFTIDLLADTNSALMKTLGLGQSEWKGMQFWERTTFVVDPRGVIRKAYEKVNPEGHEKVLLNDITALQQRA
jgi:thioredoxin-dependent peroxiredoxin